MSEYNGWRNYETWCVNMWLSNDEGIYMATQGLVRAHLTREPDGSVVGRLADEMKSFVEDLPEADAVLGTASFVADLLGAALNSVDWYEIAENWITDIKQDEEVHSGS